MRVLARGEKGDDYAAAMFLSVGDPCPGALRSASEWTESSGCIRPTEYEVARLPPIPIRKEIGRG